MKLFSLSVPPLISAALLATSAHPAPVVERLSRGVVAVQQADGKVFVSWRLLASDPDGVAFNVYRETAPGPEAPTFGNASPRREEPLVKLNPEPLAGPTWWLDAGARLERETKYFVRAVVSGVEGDASRAFALPAAAAPLPYHSV